MAKLGFNHSVEEHTIIGVSGKEVAKLYIDNGDSNLIDRFRAFVDEFDTIDAKFKAAREHMPAEAVTDDGAVDPALWDAGKAIREADLYVKAQLAKVFGEENDFDEIFQRANVMSVTLNGNTALENFLEAVAPLIQGGVEARQEAMKAKASDAVIAAKQNRAQRRAPAKK